MISLNTYYGKLNNICLLYNCVTATTRRKHVTVIIIIIIHKAGQPIRQI